MSKAVAACRLRGCGHAELVYTDVRYDDDTVSTVKECHAHASETFGAVVPNGLLREDVKAVRIVDCEPRRAVTTEYGDWT
jgi:hypothetical protein